MSDVSRYDVARSFLRERPSVPRPDHPGCFGVIAAGILIGIVLGGFLGGAYGVWSDGTIADEANRRGEVVDFVPVGVPLFSSLGSILGAILTALFLGAWVCIGDWARRKC